MFQSIFWSYPRDIGKLCPGLNFLINIVILRNITRIFLSAYWRNFLTMTLDEENSWMIFFQFDEEYGYNERNMDIFFFFLDRKTDLGTRIFSLRRRRKTFLIEFPSYFRSFSLFSHAYNVNNVTELQLVSVGFQFGSFLIDKVYIFN